MIFLKELELNLMEFRQFTKKVAKREGKKKSLSIAQINEVVKITLQELRAMKFKAIWFVLKYGK